MNHKFKFKFKLLIGITSKATSFTNVQKKDRCSNPTFGTPICPPGWGEYVFSCATTNTNLCASIIYFSMVWYDLVWYMYIGHECPESLGVGTVATHWGASGSEGCRNVFIYPNPIQFKLNYFIGITMKYTFCGGCAWVAIFWYCHGAAICRSIVCS